MTNQSDPDAAAGGREGQVLAGKYRVERVLGEGAMGVVVAARNLVLDTKVALKFLRPECAGHPDAVARFTREARAAARIVSEHVARVHDVGTLEDGTPFIVMEFLEGHDLARRLLDAGPLEIDQAVAFVLQAAVAVADAHALGIVHRDLKPGNLFCVRRSDGQSLIKVLDFGISKEMSAASPASGAPMAATATAVIMGSPFYMSPEQVQSAKNVDTRTDLWALGVVLFELLTGRVPFQGQTFGELAIKIATEPAPALRELRPDAPAGIEEAIARCLRKDREERFAHVGELALALSPFAPSSARPLVQRAVGIVHAAGPSVSFVRRSASEGVEPQVVAAAPRTLLAPGVRPPSTGTQRSAVATSAPGEPAVHPVTAGPDAPTLPGSVAPWSDGSTPARRERGTRSIVGVALVCTVLGGAVVIRSVAQRRGVASTASFGRANAESGVLPDLPAATAMAVRVSAPAASGSSAEGDASTAEPGAVPAAAANASAAESATVTSASPVEIRTAPSRIRAAQPLANPVPAGDAKAAPTAPAKTRFNCNPNYDLDAHGEKRFKPECFGVSAGVVSSHP